MAGLWSEIKMAKCKWCGVGIPKAQGRGRQKMYCCTEHRELAAESRPTKPMGICSVEGCASLANRRGAGLCEAHYMRFRRNGTTDSFYERMAETAPQNGGYVLVKAKDHPRSLGRSRAYAHRVAFTDVNGEGPFNCYWCAKPVTWADMHIDHLDDDRENNDTVNLVASCPICNQQRGHGKMMGTLRQKTGLTFNGETLTLNEWASRLGITGVSLKWRLANGWPLEKALTEGRGITGPKSKS